MSLIQRRLRSLLIALAVLALSAGAAFAARPQGVPPTHPPTSTGEQGSQGEEDQADGDVADQADVEKRDADETEAPEPPEADTPESDQAEAGADQAAGNGSVGNADAATGEHPDNHGKLVSEAAHAATPAGFANHGAYVRTVAKANHGHDGSTGAATAGSKSKGKSKNH